jgi:putative colanic acid biosynthesis UDP-glucose lipid carrier transferase
MRNRHKFTFIISCAVIDMMAMIVGTMLFLKFATEEDVAWNTLFLDKMMPITILSWLFSVTYFKFYGIFIFIFFRITYYIFLGVKQIYFN